jgi:photosystem II stability/assembly factor-like uncharacterized protein
LDRGNAQILAIDQTNIFTAYVVVETAGLRTLYRTTDGAQSWTLIHTFKEPFRSLAASGNVLYLGGMNVTSGTPAIWRSNDSGANWTPVYTATAATQVYSIALLPGSSDQAYAAISSGNNGVILKTINGINWSSSLSRPGTFQDVAVDPENPGRLFAGGNDASSHAEVYRTTTSGTSWSLVFSSATEGYDGVLTVHPDDPQIAFVKTRLSGCCPPPYANLWRTTNGGTDWEVIANRPFWGLVFARPDTFYVISDTEYTLDASATTPVWLDAPALLPEISTGCFAIEDRDLVTTVDPLVYMGFSINGVYTSTNNLGSVQAANNGFHNLLVPRTINLDPQDGQVLYVATDQDGFKSTDAGTTWTAMNLSAQPLDFAVKPDDSAVVLMSVKDNPGTGQSIFRSSNGGDTWTPVYTHSVPGTIELAYAVAFDPTNTSLAYAVSGSWSPGAPVQTAVLTSTDAGKSWTPSMIIDGMNPGFTVLQVGSNGIVYLAGRAWGPHLATLYRSDDHGATWQKKYEGGQAQILGLVFDPTNLDIVYMIEDYALLKSTDGGDTWLTILTSTSRLYSIAHDPATTGKLYLGMDGPVVKVSLNGGVTWSILGDWKGMTVAPQVVSLAISPSPLLRVLYAGLNGLWKYTNP